MFLSELRSAHRLRRVLFWRADQLSDLQGVDQDSRTDRKRWTSVRGAGAAKCQCPGWAEGCDSPAGSDSAPSIAAPTNSRADARALKARQEHLAHHLGAFSFPGWPRHRSILQWPNVAWDWQTPRLLPHWRQHRINLGHDRFHSAAGGKISECERQLCAAPQRQIHDTSSHRDLFCGPVCSGHPLICPLDLCIDFCLDQALKLPA